MADLVREKTEADGPQAFEPEKIRNIGSVSFNNGIPAIYFSGEETRKLAENMGFAIVGKFSHSIPSPHQIQKALNNIKFGRRFTWKFINAKHILVQFDDLNDYARLLSGPKGTPVWYVDRHPMRVFKWSPEFDVYCESPIAAIWCNLINLPIHLFDTEALFAIGKLLGNPIQVDRATANKTRLSFARICVEIDITKPPTEEIILDFCGKEIGQQVRWDKIPDYCLDCKHVGHKMSDCYANGKRDRPAKRNYNPPTHASKNISGNTRSGDGTNTETQMIRPNGQGNREGDSHTLHSLTGGPSGSGVKGRHENMLDIMANLDDEHTRDQDIRGKGRNESHNGIPSRREMGFDDDLGWSKKEKEQRGKRGTTGNQQQHWRPKPSDHEPPALEHSEENVRRTTLSSNRYYMLMNDGSFDTETYEDGEATGMDFAQLEGDFEERQQDQPGDTSDRLPNKENTTPCGRLPPPPGMESNC